jgi:hypothetical protein
MPKNWPRSVKSAVLHVVSVAQYSLAQARRWAADSRNARIGLKAKLDRANQENALLREEMRIKDARMKHVHGLHLGTTTIGRMLKKKPHHFSPAADPETNHICMVDLSQTLLKQSQPIDGPMFNEPVVDSVRRLFDRLICQCAFQTTANAS